MNNSDELQGKIALVTGSSTGIGAATAIELAARGATVILHGRTGSSNLDSVADAISTGGSKPASVCCDFATTESLDEFADEVWQQFGDLHILVNNAGGDVLTGINSNSTFSEKLDYLWQVDVNATLMLSRILGDRMRGTDESVQTGNGQCSIVNVGWDQSLQGMAGDSGELFATIKGAIMSMTLSLAQSLAPRVRVNCVAPGWIQTEWGRDASEYWTNRAKTESLMNRWGQPADVAQAVAFLAGDQASFVSGQMLSVNGGFRFNQGNERK